MEEAFEEETPEEERQLPEAPLEALEGHLREWVTKGEEEGMLDEELESPDAGVFEGFDEALEGRHPRLHPDPDVEEEEEDEDDGLEEEEKEEPHPLPRQPTYKPASRVRWRRSRWDDREWRRGS